MKKILGFVAALLLALSLPMTVFAEEAKPSETGSIEITETTDADGITKGMKSEDVNKIWADAKVPAGYTVTFTGDAHKVGNPADDYTQKFSVKADIVLHKGKGGIETLGGTFTLKAGNLSPIVYLTKDTTDSKNTPSKTTDNGGKKATNTADSSNMFVYGGLLVVALGAIAAVVTAKKRNA